MAVTKRASTARSKRIKRTQEAIGTVMLRGSYLARMHGFADPLDMAAWGVPLIEIVDLASARTPVERDAEDHLLPATYRQALRTGWRQACERQAQHAPR